MRRPGIEHYFKELSRVLKSGGQLFTTFFTYTEDEYPRIGTVDAKIQFLAPRYSYDSVNGVPLASVNDHNVPEKAIAWRRDYVFELFEKNRFVIKCFQPGGWLQRPEMHHLQDNIIAIKQ
jgi:hypothetical protein